MLFQSLAWPGESFLVFWFHLVHPLYINKLHDIYISYCVTYWFAFKTSQILRASKILRSVSLLQYLKADISLINRTAVCYGVTVPKVQVVNNVWHLKLRLGQKDKSYSNPSPRQPPLNKLNSRSYSSIPCSSVVTFTSDVSPPESWVDFSVCGQRIADWTLSVFY